MMKKITLFLLFTLFVFTCVNAQVFDQDYQSLNTGDDGSLAGHEMVGGSSTIEDATATGNTTQILKAVHTEPDIYVRTSDFTVSEGEVYNVSLDIATTNAVHAVTIRYSNDDVSPFTTLHPGTPASSTNGVQTGANGRIAGSTANLFGTTTATFTVPAGFNNARVQVYQWGLTNTFELDNFLVELEGTASIEDLEQFNFTYYPNPSRDNLKLAAAESIDNIEIYNLIGQQVLAKELNVSSANINLSSLTKGIYIVKVTISDAVGTFKFIKE